MTRLGHNIPQPYAAGAALTHPGTQLALERYRRHWSKVAGVALVIAGVSFLSFPIGLGFLVTGPSHGRPSIIAGIGFLIPFVVTLPAVIVFALGRSLLRQSTRMEWTLAQYPWRARHRWRFRPGFAYSRHVLLIEADQVGPEARCQLTGGNHFGRSSLYKLQAAAGYQPLLVAGEPHSWAVVTTPDMDDLCIVKPLAILR